jgi:hypothetical protein
MVFFGASGGDDDGVGGFGVGCETVVVGLRNRGERDVGCGMWEIGLGSYDSVAYIYCKGSYFKYTYIIHHKVALPNRLYFPYA